MRHRRYRPLFLILARTSRDQDPTRSITLRNQFAADARRRFRKIWKLVAESVGANDCFGLAEESRQPFTLQAIPPKQFQFRRDADKVIAFMAWLQEMIDKEILDVYYVFTEGRSGLWSDTYVMSAYQKGLIQARADLIATGVPLMPYVPFTLAASLNSPFNADRLELMYTRVFTDLKGVTESMSTQMSRVLSQALAEGIGPFETARRLVDKVENIGMARAKLIARTETIYALNSAALSEYAAAEQVIGKPILAQWWTAMDERVCSICGPRHGKIYTQAAVQAIMVPHPLCRCSILPYIEGSSV